LRESIGTLDGKSAVLLGAGGAARGAILSLEMLGAGKIHLLNRDIRRAKTLAASLSAQVRSTVEPGGLDDWSKVAGDAALVVNSTSAGMGANPPLDLDLSLLPKTAAVCDIVYNPLETKLLKDAAARGHTIIDGLGMLMHQAAPSFEAFFGVKPRVTPALRAALEKVLSERH
jgi:shikimate dehydrogenase